jgi:hypothetical protein
MRGNANLDVSGEAAGGLRTTYGKTDDGKVSAETEAYARSAIGASGSDVSGGITVEVTGPEGHWKAGGGFEIWVNSATVEADAKKGVEALLRGVASYAGYQQSTTAKLLARSNEAAKALGQKSADLPARTKLSVQVNFDYQGALSVIAVVEKGSRPGLASGVLTAEVTAGMQILNFTLNASSDLKDDPSINRMDLRRSKRGDGN